MQEKQYAEDKFAIVVIYNMWASSLQEDNSFLEVHTIHLSKPS